MEDKKHIQFIINPKSGTSSKEQLPNIIKQQINQEKYSYDIALTEYPGHATVLSTNSVKKGHFAVVVAGGDGTVNEAAQSLVDTNIALGIIPLGSGNALARELKIPLKTALAIQFINHAGIKKIDTGSVNEHLFLCAVGIGFEALVAEKFSQEKRRGFRSYIKSALTSYFHYKPSNYTIKTLDKTLQQNAFQLTISNTKQYGNNAYISPLSKLNDGKLELIILKKFKLIYGPGLVLKLFNKSLHKSKHINTIAFKEIEIEQEKKQPIHIDGEPINLGNKLNIKVKPLSLNVIAKKEEDV